MCQADDYSGVAPVEAVPATLEWKGEVVGLEPVDELPVLTEPLTRRIRPRTWPERSRSGPAAGAGGQQLHRFSFGTPART